MKRAILPALLLIGSACFLDAQLPKPGGSSSGGGSSGGSGVLYCAPASSSATTYTCAPTLSAYAAGVSILFVPDVTSGSSPTVNVNSLGAKNLKLSDGSTAVASGELIAGKAYVLTYDGTAFRLIDADATNITSGTLPTARLPAAVPTTAKWCTVTYANAAFVANATSAFANCGSALTSSQVVTGVTIKHSTAFAGTSVTSATISLGVSGSPVAFSGSALDVFQSVGTAAGKFLHMGGWGTVTMAGDQPVVYLTTNTAMGNGSATILTAGSVDVWISVVTLP